MKSEIRSALIILPDNKIIWYISKMRSELTIQVADYRIGGQLI